MAYTTKTPTGLQAERNGNEFTFSWKIRDANHGQKQHFEYRKSKSDTWHRVTVTSSQTSIAVTISVTDIDVLAFRVRGQRKEFTKKVETGTFDKKGNPETRNETVKPEMSAWKTKWEAWKPGKPTPPTITYSQTSANVGKFTVEHTADTDGSKPARYVQYSTCRSVSSASPPKDGWSAVSNINASSNVSQEFSYTEQTETITATGLVRWFRARCEGPGGISKWVYAHHAYSYPELPALKDATAKKDATRATTVLRAEWKTKSSLLKPVDEEVLQYVFAIPTTATCAAPATGWQDAISVTPSGKQDIVSAMIASTIASEQCLWVRVCAMHDTSYVKYSKAIRVATSTLNAPAINATPNFSTGSVSITLTINTSCTVARHCIFYRNPKNPKADINVAILAPGVTTTTVTVNAIKGATKSCFGAYAFVGSYSGLSITPIMKSASALDEDIAPVEPSALALTAGSDNKSVFCGLSWRWSGATKMEISWADDINAWSSNVAPKTCTVTEIGVKTWVIQGLEIGKTWHFRARYVGLIDTDEVTTAWSDISSIDLTTIPDQPTLTLGSGFVLPGGSVTASWNYLNEDGSSQDAGQVCLATVSGSTISYGSVIAHTGSDQNVLVTRTWARGSRYNLACRVRAASGRYSDWSVPVSVYCPNRPTVEFSNTVITNNVMTSLSGVVRVGLTSDGPANYSVYIRRARDYHVDRPDDGVYDGYENEIIWAASGYHYGGAQAYDHSITKANLIGELDDGAVYVLVATITDEYGQTVTREMPFRVNWTHKASIAKPAVKADVRMMAMRITPKTPTGYASGDTFDIYRITADQPELIVKDGTYGTTYVDPYPAFGKMCGHRVVAKTATGSYISSTGSLTWYDLDYSDGDVIECNALVIDANGMQIQLPYNIELTNRWQKDFKRTSYLGGSVQGDWNPAVLRDLTAKTVIIKNQETGALLDLRDLAAYAGPAHIRTPDGSSFSCDIQVTEDATYDDKKVSYSLAVKGINPAEPDGMTLEAWRDLHHVG